ncbi:MAG: sensor histidine kinase [Chloroflexi bacterium]|nr:sensor histidine kinase [Chloroflexota bacterium]
MTEILRPFFEANRFIILSVYGQVFFLMGFAVAWQSRKHSRLPLARSLGWLALFGLSHGLFEWGDIFIPVQATYIEEPLIRLLQVAQLGLLALSFAFLMEFGLALLQEALGWDRRWLALPWIVLAGWGGWIITFGLGMAYTLDAWQVNSNVLARYLLGFPASLLVAVGLWRQAGLGIAPLNLPNIVGYLRRASYGFAVYAIFGGLTPPAADFFPANWLNSRSLVDLIGIPAPVFRSLAGLVIAVNIIRALEVFDVEVDRLIEDMEHTQILAAERDRIGREIHDGAIQTIYTAGLMLQATCTTELAHSPTRPRLERVMALLNDAIRDLRQYITALRPASSGETLTASLAAMAGDARFSSLVQTHLVNALPPEQDLSPAQKIHVLAIVNEALSNVVRHAQARNVEIRTWSDNGDLCLWVKDDGIGVRGMPEGGYGLRNMRDRARLLGGQLDIQGQPGKGTTVLLRMPWDETK